MPDEQQRDAPPTNAQDLPGPASPFQLNALPEQRVREDSQSESDQKKDGSSDLAKRFNFLEHATFWTQVILAIVGLGALWVYHRQLCVMQRQMSDAEEVDRRTTETQVLSNMPLIVPFTLNPLLDSNEGNPVIRITQTWRNLGESRAVRPVVKWGWGTRPLSQSTQFQRNVRQWEKTTWIKGADASDEITMPLKVAQKLSRAKTRLYAYGQIKYQDVFPTDNQAHTRRDHLIEYCVQIARFRIGPHDAGWHVFPCDQGNCYDEECTDYPATGSK